MYKILKIKKITFQVLTIVLLGSIFTGCVGISSSNMDLEVKDGLHLSNRNIIAYAYMKNGDKLEYVTFNYEKPKDNQEVIRISSNGFYPDYNMSSREESGEVSPGCLVVMSEKDKNYKFCKSNFTGRTALATGVSAFTNTLTTFTTVGLNVAMGAISDPKFFDKDKFLKIVKDNQLIQIKSALNEISLLESKHNQDLTSLYNEELKRYNENTKNINFKYVYKDKSGLLYGKKLLHHIKINTLNPSKNLLSYSNRYENKKFYSISNLISFMNNLKDDLNKDFVNSRLKYKNEYLKQSFNEYSFYANNQNYFKLNDNISFNGKLIVPKNLKYRYGLKTTIPVQVTITSANIHNIVPSSFKLKDKNVDANFIDQNKHKINVLLTNKTNSFLTIESLTSYFDSDVYTFYNIDRELAPASKTLKSNSSYPLFSSEMTKKFNLSKITKKTISNKYTDYGFAIKYHIQDSNIEKTIFRKNSYSYLQLYKNYL